MENTAIKLTYDGKIYELTFTRETVRQMEQNGFRIQDLMNGATPATSYKQLFDGSFMARNRKLARRKIDEIYEHLDGKTELITALAELYASTLSTLTDSAAEDDGKKVTWEMI